MIVDTVLVTTTLAIAALVSHALWRARPDKPPQIRRVANLALSGAISISLAKLVQLGVLVTATGTGPTSPIAGFVDVAATVIVAVGIALLAISVLDMMMVGKQLWPKGTNATPASDPAKGETAGSHLSPGEIPAILFRREGPLGDAGVSSTFLNNKAAEVLGFSHDEMLSDPHFLTWLLHPEDRQDYQNGDEQLADAKAETVFDHRFKHRSGSYRWIRVTMKRIDDQAGKLKEIVACGMDVTDLKEAEEQLAGILSTDPCSVIPEDEVIGSD
ncbi:MAG: PAS domain-containing protein [Gammaproteobacteria bacterium]|nr:PAS domain-containing protein [Gammaproteobacteria bacterium]